MLFALVLALLYVADATHQSYTLASNKTAMREHVKQIHVDRLMRLSKKRAVAEAEAEDTMVKIQEAKRLANKMMGSDAEPDDDGLWQTDIILNKEQAEAKIRQFSGKGKRDTKFFELITSSRWPQPVKWLANGFTSSDVALIQKALSKMSAQVPCWTFQQVSSVSSADNFIMYQKDSEGCGGASPVGMQKGGNTITMDISGCSADNANLIVTHETLHSLGFEHEQCRHDRDKWVQINFGNMKSTDQHNFVIDDDTDTSYGVPFNYKSIMMYGPTTLSSNGKQTIQPLVNPTVNGPLMGNNPIMQDTDILLAKKAYCWNPNPIIPVSQYIFGDMCAAIGGTTCATNVGGMTEPAACPSGMKETIPSTMGCAMCSLNFGTQACEGGSEVANAYASYVKGAGYSCSGGARKPFVFKYRKCVATSPDTCLDGDSKCGDDAVAGLCTSAAVKTRCPKSCGTCGKS